MDTKLEQIIAVLTEIKEVEQGIALIPSIIQDSNVSREDTAIRMYLIRRKMELNTSLKDFGYYNVKVAEMLLKGGIDAEELKKALHEAKKPAPKNKLSPAPLIHKVMKVDEDKYDSGWFAFILAVLIFCKKHNVSFMQGLRAVENTDDILIGIATEFDVLTNYEAVYKGHNLM